MQKSVAVGMVLGVAFAVAVVLVVGAPIGVAKAQTLPSFTNDIQPVLNAKCLMCHSNRSRVANASVENYVEIMSNPRLVLPGHADQSGLYVAVEDDFMPLPSAVQRGFVEPLTMAEKKALAAWINAGAPNN